MAGPGLFAHVLTSKYGTTCLCIVSGGSMHAKAWNWIARRWTGWVGSRAVASLVAALRRYVLAATKVHADDTPVPV